MKETWKMEETDSNISSQICYHAKVLSNVALAMSTKPENRKFLIDCDPGSDDAQAIMMALARDDIDVVAITTVGGNTSLENATRNVLAILKVCDRLDIPVYNGCQMSLNGDIPDADNFWGVDGLGDSVTGFVGPVDMSLVQKEHAANAICRIVSEQPGCITLIALGPLTNLALCQHLDTDFGSKLKELVVMGGNYQGVGNQGKMGAAEFNFWSDPEAARVLLKNFKTKITIVPLETCLEHALDWEFYEKLTTMPTKWSKIMNLMDTVFVKTLKNQNYPKYKVWDQLAMAVTIVPTSIVESEDVYAKVEQHGEDTRGQLVINWWKDGQQVPNVKLIKKLDKTVCEKLLLAAAEHN